MNEFIKTLIGRLEDNRRPVVTNDEDLEWNRAVYTCTKIVNQLAGEYNNGWILYSIECPPVGSTREVWLTLEDGVFKAIWMRDHFEWENGRVVKETPLAWMFNDVPEPYQQTEV